MAKKATRTPRDRSSKKAAAKKQPKPARSTSRQSKKDAEKVLRDGPIVKRRPRQERLPGVEEDPGSKKIDDAAYDYVEARDARMAATTVETQRATKLLALLKKERPGAKAYKHTVGGETIVIKIEAKDPTEKVKVKIAAVDTPDVGETAPADTIAMDAEEEQGEGQ